MRGIGRTTLLAAIGSIALGLFVWTQESLARSPSRLFVVAIVLIAGALVMAQRRAAAARIRSSERLVAGLAFPVRRYVDSVRGQWSLVRVSVQLVTPVDPALLPLVADLATILPDECAIDSAASEILFVRLPVDNRPADAWSRGILVDVLGPLHEAAPVAEVRFEEDLRGPLEAPRLLDKPR